MSEPEKRVGEDGLEALLQRALASTPPPALPPSFTGKVLDRLRTRRLAPRARRMLQLYFAAAALLSAGVMASLGVDGVVIAAALAVPAAIALLLRKQLT